MPGDPAVGAILLAAGESRRLGAPKQLVRYRGVTLVRRALDAALGSGAFPVILVLGAHFEEVAAEAAGLPVLVVRNPEWPSGMASSLRCGLDALQEHASNCPSALLMVCDQPMLEAAHLGLLLQRQAAVGKVVAAQYGGRVGVPAVFPERYFQRLRAITGDQGARQILALLPPEELEIVPLDEARLDVDTAEDVSRLAED